MKPDHRHLLTAITAALHAGSEILDVYTSNFSVRDKDDKSPLTLADSRAHARIEGLLVP